VLTENKETEKEDREQGIKKRELRVYDAYSICILYIETPNMRVKELLFLSLFSIHISIHIPCRCPVQLRDSKNQIKTTIPF
jgi:hypothetical protein